MRIKGEEILLKARSSSRINAKNEGAVLQNQAQYKKRRAGNVYPHSESTLSATTKYSLDGTVRLFIRRGILQL